jgi:hypothetical protein
MALKRKIKSLEDVSEGLREFYTLQDDGGYILDAEGEDVSGIKSALERERDNVDKAKKELAKLRSQYKGIDLDEYEKILTEAEQLKKKKLLDSGQVDELIEQRLLKARKEMQEEQAKTQEEKNVLRQRLEKELIDNRLTELATQMGARPAALRDVKLRGQQTWRLNEHGDIEAHDGDRVLYGKDPTQPLSMKEWLTEEFKESPYLLQESMGAGVPPGKSPGSVNGAYVLTKDQARDPQRYRAAKEAAAKAGQEMQIVE